MFSLADFRKNIKDIARPYHWLVNFSGGMFESLNDKNRVTASMRTAALPGITINPVAVAYFGMTYNLAGTPSYEPLSAQFIIDSEYKVLDDWKKVLDQVYDYKEGQGPLWGAPTVYMGTMTLQQLDTERKVKSQYKLQFAYLSAISAIQYGHETKDAPLTFDATITYSFFIKEK